MIKTSSLLIALLAVLTLTACENASYNAQKAEWQTGNSWNPPAMSSSGSYEQFSALAPPPPPVVYEAPPVINNPRSFVWRPGYWDYSRGSFSWVSGEIISRPEATAVWAPDHWEKHTYGWAFVPGYWQ